MNWKEVETTARNNEAAIKEMRVEMKELRMSAKMVCFKHGTRRKYDSTNTVSSSDAEIISVSKAIRILLDHLKLEIEFIPETPSIIKLTKRSPK